MTQLLPISLAAGAAALILAAEHYLVAFHLGEKLPRWAAYILGMGTIYLSVSGPLVYWRSWRELTALWAVGLAGGLTVLLCRAFDDWMNARKLAKANAKIAEALRGAASGKD